jgi:hypothetical protein
MLHAGQARLSLHFTWSGPHTYHGSRATRGWHRKEDRLTTMNSRIPPPTASLTRRHILLGAAGAAVLAACGSGDDNADTATTAAAAPVSSGEAPVLVALFPFQGGYASSGKEQRLTWGLFDAPGVPMADQPDEVEFTLSRQNDDESLTPVESIPAPRRDVDIPRAYYATRFVPEAAGLYVAEIEVDGTPLSANFVVNAPAEVPLVQIGDPMREVETPTVADPLNVDPICTREPPCNFHEMSLVAPLTEGRPVAFIVSTPAFCQVSICGPVLDLVIDAQPDYQGIDFVHAEVYANPLDGLENASLAASIEAYGMNFEPALFVADADGILVDRLDNIYDADELRESLDKVAG